MLLPGFSGIIPVQQLGGAHEGEACFMRMVVVNAQEALVYV